MGLMRRSRSEFPIGVKREALERSGGICECHLVPFLMKLYDGKPCGQKLGPGNCFYEHIEPDWITKDNSLGNCCCLVKTCWHAKTNSFDKPTIADVRRQTDRHFGIKAAPREVLVGTFRSGIKKTLRGAVLDRETGLPWHERNRILRPAANGIVGPVTPLGHYIPLIEGEPT
jgi:hypothetical protein